MSTPVLIKTTTSYHFRPICMAWFWYNYKIVRYNFYICEDANIGEIYIQYGSSEMDKFKL
jgi:hypothetical protein